ncbi:co-chaperone GroES [soil metagenome]
MAKVKPSVKEINFLPTAGYILIEPFESETKTASGIYLPETATGEKPQKGKVIAIGEAEILENGNERKSPVKVSETVIYKKWGGNEVKENGKEYMFIKFEDILAIVK